MGGWTWKALCNKALFRFGKNLASSNSNPRPRDPKSGALTARPHGRFCCLRSGGWWGSTQIWNWYIFAAHCLKMGGLKSGPSLKMRGWGVLSERLLTGKTGDLGVKNIKKMYIFVKRRSFRSAQIGKAEQRIVYFWKGFWSGLCRNSRVAKSEKWGWVGGLSRGTYPYCPYMGVPPPPPPGLGFCNFRLENEFRTNFNPILTTCWVKFVKIGNAIRVFTIF